MRCCLACVESEIDSDIKVACAYAGAIPPPFPSVPIDDDTQLRSEYRADARVPPTGHAGWRNNIVVRRSDQQHHRDHNQHIAADMYGGAAPHQDHAAYAQYHDQSMATNTTQCLTNTTQCNTGWIMVGALIRLAPRPAKFSALN